MSKWWIWFDIAALLFVVFFGIIPDAQDGRAFWMVVNTFIALWWMDTIGKDMKVQ